MTSYTITATAIEHYADALTQFEDLLGRLTHEETRRVTHGELEAIVQEEGSELLRRLIQGHFDQRSAEEPIRERVVGEDGIPRSHRREGCGRRLETRFGEVIVTRRGYGGRRLRSVFPPGYGAEPAAGQVLARTAAGADRGSHSRIVR
jgi:hypothetical protein